MSDSSTKKLISDVRMKKLRKLNKVEKHRGPKRFVKNSQGCSSW